MPAPISLPAPFRKLAWANLCAQSAEQIALAAAPIIVVVSYGGGVKETGWLQTALTLPFLLFAIPAGYLADRMPRQRLMAAGEALRTLTLIAILGLALGGGLSWNWLALLGFIGTCGTVIFSVAAPALIPLLVSRQGLIAANSRIELARTSAFAAGPALGGMLVGWSGPIAAFGIAAILSVCACMWLGSIAAPQLPQGPRRHPLLEIREGAAFVFGHPLLRPVFITQFVFGVAQFMVLAAFVPHAVGVLGMSSAAIGMVLGVYGVGLVAGSLLAGRAVAAFRFGTVVGIGPVGGFVGATMLAATGWLHWPLLAAAGFFILGSGPILWVVSTAGLRQAVTPTGLLGRVSAVNILAYGSRPLGAALGGLIGDGFGTQACLATAAAVFLIQALIILASPAVRLAALPRAAGP